jgi:hypothetical protein
MDLAAAGAPRPGTAPLARLSQLGPPAGAGDEVAEWDLGEREEGVWEG